ncbi:hypothetical protein CAOG_07720 [Capsaspora owczarzaki ATCC 30864]|uniref:Cytosolic arginine sensor for mTORC1 subunit 1 n=1 Tax=Capsaspora owczarzaki (strain ATCC 30864) TaxID=595528 RepID=A0A0D2UQJ9_CAPO3|nr:hypothetical protein CAOG_07720 [Capsaspora owczarzaki ATCC 30864]KJE97286.1 hypothetical protein CAOG_007720 [Capsaspora owczarzaki ATCC 30864]|eukprot:XP_004343594.1 hypothetical protein CAOG_07720 [Capsaspora owczarzaki ATCC 30864]
MELYILPQRVRVASIPRGSIRDFAHPLLRIAFYPTNDDFFCITATKDEYTLIIDDAQYKTLPQTDTLSVSKDTWRLLQLCEGDIGPADWINKTGIVKSVTKPLAEANITIFYLSTYQNDFIMVPERLLEAAVIVLSKNYKVFDDSHTGDDYDEFGNSLVKKSDTTTVASAVQSEEAVLPAAAAPEAKKIHPVIVHDKHVYLACVPRDQLSSVALTLIELMLYSEEKDSAENDDPMRHFFSFALVDNTISLVLDEESLARLPSTCNKSAVPYRVIQCYDGPLGFEESGIVAQFAEPLADNGVHIYYMSTFLTDYTLVVEDEIELAETTLRKTGHLKD